MDKTTLPELPLHDIRVIEFTHMVMGPMCGMILADLGAEVIKVEPPGGDKTRRLPGLGIGFFRAFNRNKKSVVLDTTTPQGLEKAKHLISTADVLVENFRPGMMDELGLGYELLSRENPRLIYVSHKGFLPGPYENRLALDEVVQNMAGLTYMTGPPGRPLRAGTSVNDIMGGMFGAIGVLAALKERERTGRGQRIESGLFENCCLLAGQHLQQFQLTGEPPPPFPARLSAWGVYDTFNVAGGEQLFIGAVNDKQFSRLCEVIDRQDLARNPELATNAQRVQKREWLLPELSRSLASRELPALCKQLEAAGLPYARVVPPHQLLQDEHLLKSGALAEMEVDDGTTTKVVLLPLTLDGRRLQVRSALPNAGEQTDAYVA